MSQEGQYSKERYNPSLAHCGALHIKFNGLRIMLVGFGQTKIYPAVSGRPNAQGGFDYSQSRQMAQFVGPIPEGTY